MDIFPHDTQNMIPEIAAEQKHSQQNLYIDTNNVQFAILTNSFNENIPTISFTKKRTYNFLHFKLQMNRLF